MVTTTPTTTIPPARTPGGEHRPTAQQQARALQLAHAHRATQATHRAALAAEHPGPLATAQARLQAITTALRQAAHPALAAALDAEATTGAVLQCVLTADDDTSAAELTDALADYQHRRAAVDALLPSTPPATQA
ncbi:MULTISPECIES: hypothetical protein [Pseudonocardia]|uniref:Uncharacterized protein n=2 Tax=Pseudonocardia TaxID=1847 RepID=A0A1Y2MHW9_PSEAH|nr:MULTISPECIES: hypothetical protein [Pseudonocardia]OSY34752.1 hypothetical protein BG845_06585 [Pseudonocardia autotrophica]TDN65416.1 hypothetical protein C8E95_6903 [Pseudonocardia autotrophica]BBG05841.1 hypothetical protein Pdca_70500 [Pseudonocardia autotrophica]GEC29197.1 hypothetical protein PSA01_62260 [Pseudonocardia saturnea]